MPTNPVGVGSVNFPINLPMDEKAALGRAAFAAGCRSVGDYVRRLILKGAETENPELAAKLREVRRQYYGAALLFLCLCSVASSWLGSDQLEVRRSNVVRGQLVRRAGRTDFEFVEAAV